MLTYHQVRAIYGFHSNLIDELYFDEGILFMFYKTSFADAIVSTPGSGRHIEHTTMFLSRVQHSVLNLAKMKAINRYMLNMVNSVEKQNRINK